MSKRLITDPGLLAGSISLILTAVGNGILYKKYTDLEDTVSKQATQQEILLKNLAEILDLDMPMKIDSLFNSIKRYENMLLQYQNTLNAVQKSIDEMVKYANNKDAEAKLKNIADTLKDLQMQQMQQMQQNMFNNMYTMNPMQMPMPQQQMQMPPQMPMQQMPMQQMPMQQMSMDNNNMNYNGGRNTSRDVLERLRNRG